MEFRSVYTLAELSELQGVGPLYGVLGFPVVHSRSPQMQMAALRALGLPGTYVRISASPEEFLPTLEKMQSLPFAGWNCTVPHKVAMFEHLGPAACAESARRATAVNTVVRQREQWIGHSTDGLGWAAAIQECFGAAVGDLRLLILGAGGSAQSLVREALALGCRQITVANRTPDRAQLLVLNTLPSLPALLQQPKLKWVHWSSPLLQEEAADSDLLINTTSVGLKADDPVPVEDSVLRPGLKVYDLVYTPNSTPLVLRARALGLEAFDGRSMLLHQGAAAFALWTNQAAPLEVMRRALEDSLSRQG